MVTRFVVHNPRDLVAGDVCFLLSCGSLLSKEQLDLHNHNLVVHASDLPLDRVEPMTWQILEGANDIVHTLFEAEEQLDSGSIYLKHTLRLSGGELVDEWRQLQASLTEEMCLKWLVNMQS